MLFSRSYGFSFNVRSFFTDFTPGTCRVVQDAWALVVMSGTSPVSETTPALVWTLILASLGRESFAICSLTRTVMARVSA